MLKLKWIKIAILFTTVLYLKGYFTMKKVLSLALALLMVVGAVPILGINVWAEDTVTLSSTESADYSDLNTAIQNTPDGGTVTVKGTYNMPSGYNWVSHNKSVTITGGTFNASSVSTLNIRDAVTFKGTTLKWSGTVYANGNALKVDSDVTVSGTVSAIYGGGNGATVQSTSLTLLSGNYSTIYGGSLGGTVTGDTNVYVGGSVNSACDASSHSATYVIYGGGVRDTVKGNTRLTVADSMKANYIFGGSTGTGARIEGTAYLNAVGGTVMSIYGSGNDVDCVSNTVTTITGGTFEQIFGGAQSASVTGNVLLRVWGGTITRRIYGGCYNEATRSGLSVKWGSSRGVSGTVKLVLGSGANVTLTYSDGDTAVFARSRQKSDVDGTTHLYYSEASAKNQVKTGAQDAGSIAIMGLFANVADKTHTLSHTASGSVITESCSCGCGHSETATLKLSESTSLQYTGKEICPAFVEYSNGWMGEPLVISYENNVAPGTAKATAVFARESLSVSCSFDIWIPIREKLIGVAEGVIDGTVSLDSDLSFTDFTVSGAQLLAITEAVEDGKIVLNGHALTDLDVQISNAAQLSAISEFTQGRFTLTDNVDLGGAALTSPLLTLQSSTLSGGGCSILNYSVTDCGLIAVSGSSAVSHLKLGSAEGKINVISDKTYAAALVSDISEGSSLSVTAVTAYVNGSGALGVGGLIGRSAGELDLDLCISYGAVASDGTSGGLIAEALQGTVSNSFNMCSVSGSVAGGFIGSCETSEGGLTVKNSKNYGQVTATQSNAGGLIGHLDASAAAELTACENYGAITAENASGAAIGLSSGTVVIDKFTSNGSVIGKLRAGGVIGLIENGSASFSSVTNTGAVTNPENATGAYAGAVTSTVTADAVVLVDTALNIGSVGSATEGSGAIVGYSDTNTLTVKNSVNAGKALLNTDTQIVHGNGAVLENNRSLSMKNLNENTPTFDDLSEALSYLNGSGASLMLSTDGEKLVPATPSIYGVQRGENYKLSDSSDKLYFSVRFVITINDTLDYSRLGLRVRVGNSSYVDIDSNYVYTTLLEANGGEQKEITAEDIGGAYVYALTINKIPLEGIEPDGSVTIYATPYATDNNGNEYFGVEKSVTYVYGQCGVNG